MENMLLFVGALVSHWASFFTGGAIVAALAIYERATRRSISWTVYAAIFVAGGFLAASYETWSDEHQKVSELSNLLHVNNPDLVGQFSEITSGYTPELQAEQIFIALKIINRGATSIATNFKLNVRTATGINQTLGPIFIPESYSLKGPQGQLLATFHRTEALEDKADAQIPRYGEISGWLRFRLLNAKPEDFNQNTLLTVTFEDAIRRVSTIQWKAGAPSHVIQYIPGGAGQPISPELLKEMATPTPK
jgi:hypothetical protein